MQDTVTTVADERRKRLTREESRAQTRERLIEAAYRLFATEGIEATPIDRIAEEAGYSRGAFYSNFETKEELLKALMERESQRSEREMAALLSEEKAPEQLVFALRDYAISKTTDRRECLFYMELEMYGVRHPEVRPMMADFIHRDTQNAARLIDALFAGFDVRDHPPSELVVSSFIAMAQGLTMRQVVDPEFLSPETVRNSLSLYFDSVITNCIPQLRDRKPTS